jgi:hypothetical protein
MHEATVAICEQKQRGKMSGNEGDEDTHCLNSSMYCRSPLLVGQGASDLIEKNRQMRHGIVVWLVGS